MFSRFFVALASQNGPQIQIFFKLFRKPRLGENPYKTLAVRRKIKVRILKNHQKIDSTTRSAEASQKASQK